MTIRLSDGKHDRLKRLAEQRGVSLNKLIDEWSTQALGEFDAETRFRLLVSKGDAKRALRILDRLDEAFNGVRKAQRSAKRYTRPRKDARRTLHHLK